MFELILDYTIPFTYTPYNLYLQGHLAWVCNKTAVICHILSCPLYIMYNSGWILSLFGTNDPNDFAIKLLKYGTSKCPVHFTSWTVRDEFFPYLAQMTTSRGCVTHNHLWPYMYLQDYLAVMLPILWIIFTNTTHEGTTCHVPFLGQ